MTYDMKDGDGNVKSIPLFTNINVHTLQHTFTHPKGLLFATQFMQIALVIMSHAAFEDMRLKGFIQPDAAFTSHSLGEFSTLTSIADILPNFSPDVVFYHGLTMQHAVKCDEQSHSNYDICAVYIPHQDSMLSVCLGVVTCMDFIFTF